MTAVAARSMASAEKATDFIGSGEPTTDVVKAASKADIVFITTPDGAIKNVCDKIAAEGGLKAGSLVVHMFGAQSLDILAGARSSGSYRAVIHPLQSVPSPAQGVHLPGIVFQPEADPEGLEAARDLVKALGGVELVMSKWSPTRTPPHCIMPERWRQTIL